MNTKYHIIVGKCLPEQLAPSTKYWNSYYYRVDDVYPLQHVIFNSQAPMLIVENICDEDVTVLKLRGCKIHPIDDNIMYVTTSDITLKHRIHSGIL